MYNGYDGTSIFLINLTDVHPKVPGGAFL